MQSTLFDLFVEDFLEEKAQRTILIIGASKIEDLLHSILSKYFIEVKTEDLLEGDNPLSTFSAKIKICYRLGIINKELLKVLDQIRKLRNLCAHSVVFNVQRSPAREHLKELKNGLMNRTSFKLTKKRYFVDEFSLEHHELQCVLTTVCVLLESVNLKMETTIGIDSTLKISSR